MLGHLVATDAVFANTEWRSPPTDESLQARNAPLLNSRAKGRCLQQSALAGDRLLSRFPSCPSGRFLGCLLFLHSPQFESGTLGRSFDAVKTLLL